MPGKRILFIDDEPEYIRPQVNALKAAGYEVHLRPNPDEAVDYLQHQEPDLIILDLIMPPRCQDVTDDDEEIDLVETGVKLHEDIREEMGLVDIPIIFLSVVRDRDIRRELSQREKQYGHRARFLTKPVSSADVVAQVQQALSKVSDPLNK